MIQANSRYSATVASVWTEMANSGAPGIGLRFDCGANGTIDHVLYVVQNVQSIEIAEKALIALGSKPEFLRDPAWWAALRAGKVLIGAECEIVTTEEEYEGKKRVRVKFINGRKPEWKPGVEQYLATLFGGSAGGGSGAAHGSGGTSANGAPPDFPPTDEPRDEDAAAAGGKRRYY